jgi:hypothetical protein
LASKFKFPDSRSWPDWQYDNYFSKTELEIIKKIYAHEIIYNSTNTETKVSNKNIYQVSPEARQTWSETFGTYGSILKIKVDENTNKPPTYDLNNSVVKE